MICTCGAPATEKHHRFSRTKWALRLYRAKLLDDDRNLMPMCYGCHHQANPPRWTEAQFCEALGIRMRSKTARAGVYKEASNGR